jgi:hypothetical protein
MPAKPPDDTPARSMDEIADELLKIFSDSKVKHDATRRWLYDAEQKLFYRDPLDLELEKIFDEVLGIERPEDDNDPRPIG